MNYASYIKSPRWGRIRRRVLRRDEHRCRSCGGRAWQVHHGRYDAATLCGETLEHLFSLCGTCHEAVSRDIFGRKRPLFEQARWTEALVTEPKKRAKREKTRPLGPIDGRKRIDVIRARSLEYAEGRMS